MSTFTRSQLYEYFGERYSPEQIDNSLMIMAQNGAKIDPDAEEFSDDITEELEGIFNAVGEALNNQQQLGQSDEITVKQASKLAAQYSRHSSPQLMAAMIKMAVQDGIRKAAAINQIKNHVFNRVLEQGDAELVNSVRTGNNQTTDLLMEWANDGERVDKMLGNYGIKPVDIDAFLLEVNGEIAGTKAAVKAIAPKSKTTIDIDAFLLEAGE
ncbi:hypothetical protein H6G80_27115 [Nostoc sp. FACHB-87]|uniref:hypothetical protein n=1 Tax=Nostocales TaxID=1161 RepID=UPI001686712E|nr:MULTISPECIES: hypothetical protein [Nostocales]MBD2457729.1 hypothetical protein [Nostoc sp. FACHB-87]MBD2478808.1 hypothetical protein [Anabaena sp. FACHB-83]MBD2492583.1 hypothetical protein [Aulosira sp. FACHB-615]